MVLPALTGIHHQGFIPQKDVRSRRVCEEARRRSVTLEFKAHTKAPDDSHYYMLRRITGAR